MITKSIRSLLFLIAAVTACRDSSTGALTMTSVDSAGITITSIGSSLAAVREWKVDTIALVTLASPDSAGFVRVSSAHWMRNGEMVVADASQRQLYRYDDDGQYLGSIGRDGNGPGEFRSIMTVSVVGDTIGVWDLSARRLSLFALDSGFRKLIPTPRPPSDYETAREIWITQGARPLTFWLSAANMGPLPQGIRIRRWQSMARLALSDSAGNAIVESIPFNGTYSGQSARGDARQLFSNTPYVAVAQSIAFGSGEKFEVQIADPGLKTRRIVRWMLAAEPLTADEVAEAREQLLASMPPGAPKERIEEAVSSIVAQELLPATRPAISRALWDDAGRLWLGRFEPPVRGLAESFDWVVLDSASIPVGRVRLPETARLEAIRGDDLLVSVRDSLDVQTVQVWRMQH